MYADPEEHQASSSNDEPKKELKNRPSKSGLKQQKLKAWQPSLTATTVIPAFFIIGVIFIPIGAVLLVASNSVVQYVYDYTSCPSVQDSSILCKDIVNSTYQGNCKCDLSIEIKEDIKSPIYIYYGLTNYYQNHRRYTKSRDNKQLLGRVSTNPSDVSSDCDPFRTDSNGKAIAPCGAMANSLFDDSYFISNKESGSVVMMDLTGIAWPSDHSTEFKNPSDMSIFDQLGKPVNWTKQANCLSNITDENGFKNESFNVWMQPSALPHFRKLYARVSETIVKGNYNVHVDYNYPVFEFSGKKRFIISTTSWAGGKNPFLGIAYIVVGCLCIVVGIIFSLIHWKFGKSHFRSSNLPISI